MNSFRKIKIIVVSLLLPAMLLLSGNAVFNWHVHKSSDGSLIVHSHPYQKTGNTKGTNNHHHSSHECFSLQQITSFLFVLSTVLFLKAFLGKALEVSKLYKLVVKRNVFYSLQSDRAPPALV